VSCANLAFLERLEEADVQWLIDNGHEYQVGVDSQVVREGETPAALYFVLSGRLGVRIPEFGNAVVGTLGPGRVVGEISLIDSRPATASVCALENSQLLACSRNEISHRLAADPPFAARFFRAVALDSVGRLQERTSSYAGRGIETAGMVPAQDCHELQRLLAALRDFAQGATELDTAILRNGGRAEDDRVAALGNAFSEVLDALNEIYDAKTLSAGVREEAARAARRELLPLLMLSECGERFYAKPRGYAGDYLTIHKIYQNEPHGHGRVGPYLDRFLLELSALRAARQRRTLLAAQIDRAIGAAASRTANVTTMACGPAAEVFDVYARLEDPGRLRTTLIDIDLQALAFVGDRRDAAGLRRQMELVPANLVYLATGRQKLELPPQDLIYSVGLIDYFNDEFVVKLLNLAFEHLRPGGRVILGNFHPRNPARVFQDVVLDWPLVHRTERELDAVFAASRFGKPCDEIFADDSQVQLFGVASKA